MAKYIAPLFKIQIHDRFIKDRNFVTGYMHTLWFIYSQIIMLAWVSKVRTMHQIFHMIVQVEHVAAAVANA